MISRIPMDGASISNTRVMLWRLARKGESEVIVRCSGYSQGSMLTRDMLLFVLSVGVGSRGSANVVVETFCNPLDFTVDADTEENGKSCLPFRDTCDSLRALRSLQCSACDDKIVDGTGDDMWIVGRVSQLVIG